MQVGLKDTPQTRPSLDPFRYIRACATILPRRNLSGTNAFLSYALVQNQSLYAMLTTRFPSGSLLSRNPGLRSEHVVPDLHGQVRTNKTLQAPLQAPVQVPRTGVPGKIVTTPNGIPTGTIRIGAAPHGHIGNLRKTTADETRVMFRNTTFYTTLCG